MLIFYGVLTSAFMMALSQLVLATVLPVIVQNIGGMELYGWVFSGYMLASIFTIPIFSKLADIYGRRRFYIIGLMIFAAGSILGGLSNSIDVLIAGRIIQGTGAGIVTPVSIAMLTDLFPPEKRGGMIGIFSVVQLLANLLSPILGGLITQSLSWRFIFYLIASIVLLVAAVTFLAGEKRQNTVNQTIKIDIKGSLLLGAFCSLTVIFVNIYGKSKILDFKSILLLVISILTAILLYLCERKCKEPIINIKLLSLPLIRKSIINALLSGAVMYGIINLLPLAGANIEKHMRFIDGGKLLLMFMIAMTIGMFSSGRLHSRLKRVNFTGILWIIAGVFFALIVVGIKIYSLHLFLFSILPVGFCTGGIMATMLVDSQNAVDEKDRTVLSGFIQLCRYFGASVGVILLTLNIQDSASAESLSGYSFPFFVLALLGAIGIINSFFKVRIY